MKNFLVFQYRLILAGLYFMFAINLSCDMQSKTNEKQRPDVKGSVSESMKLFGNLVGTWKMAGRNGTIYESWQWRNDSLLQGMDYQRKEEDTIVLEKLEIKYHKGDYYYLATVPHNPAQVPFKLINFDSNTFIFENPDHDFPQRIGYQFINNDSIQAWIEGSGKSEGEVEKRRFFFRRVEKEQPPPKKRLLLYCLSYML